MGEAASGHPEEAIVPGTLGNPLTRLIGIMGGIGSILFLIVALIVVFEVIMRSVFKSPTAWAGEISGLLTIVGSLIMFSYTLQEKGHTRVDFITVHLSPRSNFILNLFTTCLATLFCTILTVYGVKMVRSSYELGEVTQILQFPLWVLQSFVPLSAGLMALTLLRFLWEDVFINRHRKDVLAARGASSLRYYAVALIFAAGLLGGVVLLKISVPMGLFILFFALLFNGMPVSYAMGLFGATGLFFLLGGFPAMVHTAMQTYSSLDSQMVIAFPLFFLSGSILRAGEVGPRIFNFAYTLVRHLPGGMGIASIIFCGIFAAMTGSSIAVASAVSVIALPEMLKRGYSRKFTIGMLAAGGTLGILFPPSLPLIFYAALTTESISSLFMGAVVPGILLTLMFIAYTAWVGARDKNIMRDKRAGIREIYQAVRASFGGLVVIVIIIGGIYSGVFTVTEAGAVACLYSIFLCVFWYRTLSWRGLFDCVLKAGKLGGMITLIIVAANIASVLITMTHITQDLLQTIRSLALPGWTFIGATMILMIIMGGPLEAVSIMVICCPILYPIVTALGFSGVWFGVSLVINTELALISPPEGVNIFILQEIAKSTTGEVSKGVIPFCIIMCLFLLIVLVFPPLVLWLPGLMK
jgi:C4-dicarboxylate transporter, DctM subunit